MILLGLLTACGGRFADTAGGGERVDEGGTNNDHTDIGDSETVNTESGNTDSGDSDADSGDSDADSGDTNANETGNRDSGRIDTGGEVDDTASPDSGNKDTAAVDTGASGGDTGLSDTDDSTLPIDTGASVDTGPDSGADSAAATDTGHDTGSRADTATPDTVPATDTGSALADTGDADGDGSLNLDDCDDVDPEAHPGATEYCDDEDQDCDGDNWDTGGCAETQDLGVVSDGIWEGDTGFAGNLNTYCPAFVGDLDGDGTDDLAMSGGHESTDSPGSNFGGIFYVPGGQTLSGAMSRYDSSTAWWVGDAYYQSLMLAWPAGDVDGDGSDDLWLGTSGYQGVATLLRGPPSAWTTGEEAIDAGDVSWYGEAWEDSFVGASAATDVDFDADGFADAVFLSISAGSSTTGPGNVYVVFGRGDVADSAARSIADEVRITGDEWQAHVASGDLDADGTADLLVSQDDDVMVLDGLDLPTADGAALLDLAGAVVSPDTTLGPSQFANQFCFVGDWDGDGFDDWVAADYKRPSYRLMEGEIYLFPGGSSELSRGSVIVDDLAVASVIGDGTRADLGGDAVSCLDDLDGDGVGEFAASTYRTVDSVGDLDVVVFSSVEGIAGTESSIPDRALRVRGDVPVEGIGYLGAFSGDFDGDGEPDLGFASIGSGSQPGRTYLILGGSIPWTDSAAW
ncbi:MAG: MopE-related protein [Myxococcota bacterium]